MIFLSGEVLLSGPKTPAGAFYSGAAGFTTLIGRPAA
jgi:hypothetical protein